MSVRVVAPCRLHFGLFHVPVDGLTHHPDGRPVRKFGGLGMMIDNPCVTVTAKRSAVTTTTGNLAARAGGYVQRLQTEVGIGEWQVHAAGPHEHVGLGVGTALGMSVLSAVAEGVSQFSERRRLPHHDAKLIGRGERSGVGIYGFCRGGFRLDDGKPIDDGRPSKPERHDFPNHWRIVLVRPPTPPAWFGDRERTAFARTRPADRALSLTDRLRSLAYDTVVPAVRDEDFDTFARAIFEFNRLAGEPFHDDQGGPYAGAEVACVIDELMEMGAVGVGQSSWGPTVFAMCRDEGEAEGLATKARARFSSATEVTVTAANNTGARIETV